MELKDILAWVDARRAVKGWSDQVASQKAGHPYAIQNMRKTLRNGRGSIPKLKTLKDLARVLGEPPADLFEPTAIPREPAGPAPTVDVEVVLETRLAALEAEADRVRSALQLVREARRAG